MGMLLGFGFGGEFFFFFFFYYYYSVENSISFIELFSLEINMEK